MRRSAIVFFGLSICNINSKCNYFFVEGQKRPSLFFNNKKTFGKIHVSASRNTSCQKKCFCNFCIGLHVIKSLISTYLNAYLYK